MKVSAMLQTGHDLVELLEQVNQERLGAMKVLRDEVWQMHAAHAPQPTVRWVPQRSLAVSVPQLAESRPQIDASASGAQPQTPAVQVSLPAQEPQSS